MSIMKRDSCSQNESLFLAISTVHGIDKPNDISTRKWEELQASPTNRSAPSIKLEGTRAARRRPRRRPKKRNLTSQSPSDPTKYLTPALAPSESRSCTHEPWPVPFPQADRGIYPYLPPAQQFDQMARFTSANEEHIDKWELHNGTYPVPLLRQVLSAQECVHMGFYAQLEYLDRMLEELEKLIQPVSARERARRGKAGEKYHRGITPQMLKRIKFMRSITKQQQICCYESRIPTRPD